MDDVGGFEAMFADTRTAQPWIEIGESDSRTPGGERHGKQGKGWKRGAEEDWCK